jgi:hypothetical protein
MERASRRDLINYAAALQIETLGASVKLWTTWMDAMSWYGWQVSQSLAKIVSADANANDEVDELTRKAWENLDHLKGLPKEIGDDFLEKVERRAGVSRRSS